MMVAVCLLCLSVLADVVRRSAMYDREKILVHCDVTTVDFGPRALRYRYTGTLPLRPGRGAITVQKHISTSHFTYNTMYGKPRGDLMSSYVAVL